MHFLLLYTIAEEYLPDILEELIPIIPRYYSLGRSLRLDPHQLNKIRKTYLLENDAEQALNDVLFLWLSKQYDTDRFGSPTWQALIIAVAERLGGNNIALARKMASNHPAGKLTNIKVTDHMAMLCCLAMYELDNESTEHRSATKGGKARETEERRESVLIHAAPDHHRHSTKPKLEQVEPEVDKNVTLQADTGIHYN